MTMTPKEKFTKELQEWVNTPDGEKDWEAGALLVLRITNNQILYRNLSVNPKGKAEFIKGKIESTLKFRLSELTHEQVEEMQKKVDEITTKTIKPQEEFKDFKAGKRADHDKLPEEVQALYVENLNILHKMRELHMQLRNLSKSNMTCPDSDRYPFLKELIELDKKLHENWDTYDHFIVGQTQSQEQQEKAPAKSKKKAKRKK